MTYTAHPTEAHEADTSVHVVTWTLSMLGLFAAALGTWLAIAAEDATITINSTTWSIEEVPEFWAPLLLIAGGAVAAIGMVVSSVRDSQHGASRWLIAAEIVIAMAGVAAVVGGIALIV